MSDLSYLIPMCRGKLRAGLESRTGATEKYRINRYLEFLESMIEISEKRK